MVLIRKRFFRRHCEELLRRSKQLKPSRTKTIFDKAFTFSTRVAGKRRYNGGPISGPTDARPAGDYASERLDSPNDMEGSQPRASSVEDDISHINIGTARNSPVDEKSGSTTAQASIAEPYAQTQSPPAPRTVPITRPPIPMTQTRTIQIAEPDMEGHAHVRHRLRARSRGLSIATTANYPMEPLRKVTTLPARSHNIPNPVDHKHTGMGGFPTPIQVVGQLLPDTARSTLRNRFTRPERRYTVISRTDTIQPNDPETGSDDSLGGIKATVARWMPEKLGGLVIGRNSRFFSEELDDEELEELGGVEYRALRLLSYLVPAVRPVMDSRLMTSTCSCVKWCPSLSSPSTFRKSHSGIQSLHRPPEFSSTAQTRLGHRFSSLSLHMQAVA